MEDASRTLMECEDSWVSTEGDDAGDEVDEEVEMVIPRFEMTTEMDDIVRSVEYCKSPPPPSS
jgi:hypothetical protein